MNGQNAFDFLHGDWKVHHRRLKTRLATANDWYEFDGTSSTRPIMGRQGNIEENLIADPNGSYHAVALRAFESRTGLWRIWWLDQRSPSEIGVPVVGRFVGENGEFMADDVWAGKPIKVRFVWHKRSGGSPLWEQYFSDDAGCTWELNWSMRFT